MICKQDVFINASMITLMIAGLALGGLLLYGATSGHEIPIWPAIAVTVVNLVAAAKVVVDVKKSKRQQPPPKA